MNFHKMPVKGDILEYIDVSPFLKNNKELRNVPDGRFEVLYDPIPLKENPFNCSYKIGVCPIEEN